MGGHRKSILRAFLGATALALAIIWMAPEVTAQDTQPPLGPNQLLDLIKTKGKYAFAAAAADIAAAQARLEGVWSNLRPSLTGSVSAKRFESKKTPETRKTDVFSKLELVQPIFDFGVTFSRIDAAESDVAAAEERLRVAHNIVLLEGLAVFFDLHSSELHMHSVNQAFTQAYVRWERSKEQLALGRTDAVDVSERLALVETSRHTYYRERSRNGSLRLRLEDLTGVAFTGELIDSPKPPANRPKNVNTEKLIALAEKRNPEIKALAKRAEALAFRRDGTNIRPRIEAFGNVGNSTRESRGRDNYAIGARLTFPFYDGGVKDAERARLNAEHSRVVAELEVRKRKLRRQIRTALLDRSDSWQQIIAAKAQLDMAGRQLTKRQLLYDQERVADLGTGMINFSKTESDLVRATGAFYMDNARLATLIGEEPSRGLVENFLVDILGPGGTPDDQQYTPKEGSGFGQEDQNKIN